MWLESSKSKANLAIIERDVTQGTSLLARRRWVDLSSAVALQYSLGDLTLGILAPMLISVYDYVASTTKMWNNTA